MKTRRRCLVLAAGLVWIWAGVKILRIGLSTWNVNEPFLEFHMLDAGLVFTFFIFIFHRTFTKNIQRISAIEVPKNPFAFFDLKGWGIMAFMITLGIVVRSYQLLPPAFIAPFYTGLSSALFLTGVIYLFKIRSIQ